MAAVCPCAKCVHRQGGMLIDSLREHHLAGDIGRGDVFFYYTTP
jgi:acetoacetyl-CoA synthetase